MCVFFNDTATTEIYTLSLHDALPIFATKQGTYQAHSEESSLLYSTWKLKGGNVRLRPGARLIVTRSEEHTSELQSRQYLVCRLLLEKKNNRARKHPASQ